MSIRTRFYGTALLLAVLATSAHAQTSATRDPRALVAANPLVTVTTQNPREININKPATFVFTVSNRGKFAANNVVIATSVPEHAKLTSSTPRPMKIEGLVHRFDIGTLAPGASRRVTLVTVPNKVAPINLDSTVSFETSTRASVAVRQPMLKVTPRIVSAVVIGSKVDWIVRVTNTGDGPADDVLLTPSLIAGKIQGNELTKAVKVGLLKAGESKDVKYSVVPALRGKLTARFLGNNPDGLKAEQESTLKVLQAQLAVKTRGPQVQPIARDGSYEVLVTNPGDAPTGSTLVTVTIPSGLDITAAPDNAWDEEKRTLRWRITSIRPTDTVPLRFKAETAEEGVHTLRITAESASIATASTTHVTKVISRPNPIVTVLNDQELTAVGAPISFKVMVVNAGSKVADNLHIRVTMPKELKAVTSSSYKVVDGMIEFPLQKLESGDKVSLPFRALSSAAGEHRIRVLINCVGLMRELSFEGSAFCYSENEVADKPKADVTETRARATDASE